MLKIRGSACISAICSECLCHVGSMQQASLYASLRSTLSCQGSSTHSFSQTLHQPHSSCLTFVSGFTHRPFSWGSCRCMCCWFPAADVLDLQQCEADQQTPAKVSQGWAAVCYNSNTAASRILVGQHWSFVTSKLRRSCSRLSTAVLPGNAAYRPTSA